MFQTVPVSIIRSLFTVHCTIAECTVNKLLMMDRGTVQNMEFHAKINLWN